MSFILFEFFRRTILESDAIHARQGGVTTFICKVLPAFNRRQDCNLFRSADGNRRQECNLLRSADGK